MGNNLDNLMDLQRVLQDYRVMITFSGRFTQEVIEELGDAVRKYVETEAASLKDTLNVFSVFIEQTQNIKNYCVRKAASQEKERISNSGVVAIGKSGTGYFVSSGNLVETQDVPSLVEKLDRIQVLDKLELKKLYKEQMKKEVAEDSSGAGLGLIDMARKASEPLRYSIVKIDETVCFFTLQVRI